MKKILILGILGISFLQIHGQSETQIIIDDFFKLVEKGQTDKAIEELYSNSPYKESIQDDIDNVKIQMKSLKSSVGEYMGHEKLINKTLANCFEVYMYVVKYDRQPMSFEFEFYKPNDQWTIHSFSYNQDIDDEFGKWVKFEMFNENNTE